MATCHAGSLNTDKRSTSRNGIMGDGLPVFVQRSLSFRESEAARFSYLRRAQPAPDTLA